MDFEMWNDEDKIFRWVFRAYILFLFTGALGFLIFLLYLLRHY